MGGRLALGLVGLSLGPGLGLPLAHIEVQRDRDALDREMTRAALADGFPRIPHRASFDRATMGERR